MQQLTALGAERFLASQLRPGTPGGLPAPIQAQIDAMSITQRSMEQLIGELEQRRLEAEALTSDTDKATALQAYQHELHRLAREAATRVLLRALYAPTQLHEHMVWFWLNHFSVFQQKRNIRAMLGDYEEQDTILPGAATDAEPDHTPGTGTSGFNARMEYVFSGLPSIHV